MVHRSRRVLFLSANVGGGHSSAARAVREALLRHDPLLEPLMVDSYQYVSSFVGKVVEDGYLQMVKILPQLYGYFYERREKAATISGFKNWLNHHAAGNFKNLIDSCKPSVVVCTHAFPCGACAAMKEKLGVTTPAVGVVTDLVVHPFWIYKNLDLYTVPNPEMESTLVARGIAPEKIKVTGIPIDPGFNVPRPREKLRANLGIDESLPVVLVMGGGLGMEPVGKIVKSLRDITAPMYVLVYTGKNKRLKRKLGESVKKLADSSLKIRVYDYVNNIYEFMQAADLLVTKPGGLTSSEALAAGLPMIIMNPIPGHEIYNCRYLVSKRVAVAVESEKELAGCIEELLASPVRLEAMRRRAQRMGVPYSAEAVARAVLELMEKKILAPV